MKNLLPYLGALALGASILIATNDKAAAQTPATAPRVAVELSQVQLIPDLRIPTGSGALFIADTSTSILLRESEIIITQQGVARYHVPMSAVGWYKVASDE